MQFSKLEP